MSFVGMRSVLLMVRSLRRSVQACQWFLTFICAEKEILRDLLLACTAPEPQKCFVMLLMHVVKVMRPFTALGVVLAACAPSFFRMPRGLRIPYPVVSYSHWRG